MKTPLFDLIDNLSIGETIFLLLIFFSISFAFLALLKTIIKNKEEIQNLKELCSKK